GPPAVACVGDPRAIGHVLKGTVAAVAIQAVPAPVSDEQIVVAVVLVVADAGALAPPARGQTRARGHVLERAAALVPVEMIDGRTCGRESFERRSVDEEQVEPAVVVVVDRGDAGAGRLEEVLVRGR